MSFTPDTNNDNATSEKKSFQSLFEKPPTSTTNRAPRDNPASDVDEFMPVAASVIAAQKSKEVKAPAQERWGITAFAINVWNCFKLALFIPVKWERISSSWWQLMLFALLFLATPTVFAYVVSAFKGHFSGEYLPYSFTYAVFPVAFLFIAGLLSAHAAKRANDITLITQVFFMTAVGVDIFYYGFTSLLQLLPNSSSFFETVLSTMYPDRTQRYWMMQMLQQLPFVWLAAACGVAAIRFAKAVLPEKSTAPFMPLLVGFMTIVVPLTIATSYRVLWEPGESINETAEAKPARLPGLESEDNFYLQPALLQDALDAISPERPGIVDMYFIGMAGYAEENVFRREVDSVTTLFEEKFDAQGRTIKLINNKDTAGTEPIASMSSLRAALKQTADQMNKEEDILFLFLTSHGSKNHEFSLVNSRMVFDTLNPEKLRGLLDDSDIKHRVIVVSACYSGGFIEALKDEHTLVITASAKDKTSFGCADENEWTDFGRAFFDESLRSNHSFVEAFEATLPVIEEREKKSNNTPSNPQMDEGEKITAKLKEFYARLNFKTTLNSSETTVATEPNPASLNTNKTNNAADTKSLVDTFAENVYPDYYVAQLRQECKSGYAKMGPNKIYSKNKNTYNGLNPSHASWPQLVSAWTQFSENFCNASLDGPTLRANYAKQILALVDHEAPINDYMQYIKTPLGQRALAITKQASLAHERQHLGEGIKAQEQMGELYTKVQTQLIEAYLAEQRRKGKNIKD